MKKPSRYLHEKQDWNLNDMDIFPDCPEPVVKCPKGYVGHVVVWLNVKVSKWENGEQFFDTVIRVNHSHFVRNRDTGRHVDDVIGHRWIPARYTVTTRRLNYARLPQWIKDENMF